MRAALDGIRVLDLTSGVAGPIAGMFLADFGADVVKVERSAGDPARAKAGFAVWNRGKRGIVLEPSDSAGVEWMHTQVAGADVLLITGREQLTDFGLDLDSVLARHRRLVIGEIPAYLLGYCAWHGGHESAELLAAIGGQSWRQNSVSGDPVDSVSPTVAYLHGVWAAECVLAALVEREASNAGQLVTIDGSKAIQILTTYSLTVDPDSADPTTAVGSGGRHPTYTRMLAGDGKWFASGALGTKFETALLGALGLSDMLAEERMGGLVANLVHPDNIDWAQKKVADAVLSQPRDYWLTAMDDLGIPNGPLDDRELWLDHPQVKAIGMRLELDDPERGHVVMPDIPLNLTGTPGVVRGPAPMLGQHTGTVELWPAQPEGDPMAPIRPGPLTGFSVLNIGTFVAIPYGGGLLADLGADVIKVEPLTGDPNRVAAYASNRGVRSLALDLSTPEGQAVFHKLAAQSDAFMDGLRPGVTSKMHIDHDSLAALNPGIVTLSLSAYGEGGEIGHKPGVDMVVQAMSGMMTAQGGDSDPVANTIAICDVTTAAISAMGITLGLFHRLRTGDGQRIWDALTATATFLQSGEIVRYANRPPSPLGGRDFPGPGPYDRMYQAADGWIRIQAAPGQDGAATMLGAGLGIDATAHGSDPARTIAGAVAGLRVIDAVEALNAAGMPTVSVRKVSEVLRDPRLIATEFLYLTPQDTPGRFIAGPGNRALFSRTGRLGPMIPPGVGEQSVQVLQQFGYSPEEAAQLVEGGTVFQGGRMAQTLAAAYR